MTSELPDGSHEPDSQSIRDSIHAAARFFRVLRQRRSLLIMAVLVAGMLGVLFYLTTSRIYRADASLLVLQTGSEVWNPSMTAMATGQSMIPTYERLLSSAVVLDGAIKILENKPASVRVDFASAPKARQGDVLSENLSVKTIRRTNLIDISYRSKDPRAAEAVVSAVIESYLAFMKQNHRDISTQIVTILDKERKEIEKQLKDKQTVLLQVKRRVGDLGLRQGSNIVHPAVQRVLRLNETLVEVQKERIQLQATLTTVRSAILNGGDLRQHLTAIEPAAGQEMILSALGLNAKSNEMLEGIRRKLIDDRAQLEMLMAHLGPAHPRVVQLTRLIGNSEKYLTEYQTTISERMTGIQDGQLSVELVPMLEERLAKTWSHENVLYQQYAAVEAAAVQLNDRMAELEIVEHDLVLLRNLHDSLLDRIANIDVTEEHADVRVAVVSEPQASDHPISPNLPFVCLVCLVGGLVAGTSIVYVLDLLDDRFRSPEEVKAQMGVPVLAIIPKLSTSSAQGTDALQVQVDPQAVESEGFRTLRTTLAFSGEDMNRVAITSAEPGDGKTTVLANLGACFSQAGKKTLLIDADLRRPGLTRLLGHRGPGGLVDVLRSDCDVAELCGRHTRNLGVDGLDLLPSGTKPSDPAEVLTSVRMEQVLAWADSIYDQVLVDCPPLSAASDAAIIGRLVYGVVLVVQPEKNHRRLVLRTAENLKSMQVHLVGVVINRVSLEKDGGYDYGYGYGYGYRYDDTDDERRHAGDDVIVPRRVA